MSNIVKLRDDLSCASSASGAALDMNEEARIRTLELFAATKEEVGRAIFSIDLMVQHSRLIIARVSDTNIRAAFENDLRAIEQALDAARKICHSL